VRERIVILLFHWGLLRYPSLIALFLSPYFINTYEVDSFSSSIVRQVVVFLGKHRDCGWYLLGAGVSLAVVSEVGGRFYKSYFERKKCEKCRQEWEADYKTRLFQLLKHISEKNKIFETTQRISVYKHDQEAKQFIMLGRYSSSPEYNKEGRVCYPDDQGAIKSAWEKGSGFIEITASPAKNFNAYIREFKEIWYIPENVTQQLRMKSVYYSTHVIHDGRGYPIAVVVFESTKKLKDKKQKHESIKNHIVPEIARFILQNERYEPSLSIGRKEGL
jgi:hypothetical protein